MSRRSPRAHTVGGDLNKDNPCEDDVTGRHRTKMGVSDFDAFIHGCTKRYMQNFVNIDPMSASNRQGTAQGTRPGQR